MASLSLKDVCKVYPNGYKAVQNFNMEIADKEFIIFVGPSGCGKSTTLRMIAGLEDISSGEFKIDGKLMNDVEPKDRDIAMVFQNYALYPHMTVYDNMAFGLKLRKVPKDEVKEAARILDLTHLLDRKPKALSGGQRQRVAMGRAIVRNPKVFLMDEPLSNLDAKLRVQMRTEIAKLHQRLGTTIIYVTHDQTEAMTLGSRIVVMKDGIVQQIDKAFLDVEGQSIELPADKAKKVIDGGYNGKPVVFGIRPESIIEVKGDKKAPYQFESKVNVYELLGAEVFLYFDLGNANITARVEPTTKVRPGDTVKYTFDTKKIHVFDKETELTIAN